MFACVTGFVLGYASKRVVVSCFVRGHNHGSAGAAQHLETAWNQWINTARDRRRPILLVPKFCLIHSKTYSGAFDMTRCLE
jgi:hypothetical protein